MTFAIQSLELGPMENFVYFIHDLSSNRAAVVDPAWDVPQLVKLAKKQNIEITDVLLTHSHYDHINGLNELLETYDAEIHLLKSEAQFWDHDLEKPTIHYGGDRLEIGKTSIEILHTPGHTPGSACYHLDGNLITGDTLFLFGCGRCDFNGGNPEQMYNSLKKLGSELNPETIIHPGHNYAHKCTSTMAEQLEGNPFMQINDLDKFIDYRMHQHDLERDTPYTPIVLT
jgi:glyoxylase-like metal-dependent hydrolase (beta-lactamase superfamily II)